MSHHAETAMKAAHYLPHAGLLGLLIHYFGWLKIVFDWIAALWEKTQWLRDVSSWKRDKKPLSRKRDKRKKR